MNKFEMTGKTYNQYILIVSSVFAVIFLVHGGNSLYCYVCNSLETEGCTMFDVPKDMETVKCPDNVRSADISYPPMCRKTDHYRYPGGGKLPIYHSTWRSCVNVQPGTKATTQREYNPESVNHTHYCKAHYCNSH